VVNDVTKLPEEVRTCTVCLEDVCCGNQVCAHMPRARHAESCPTAQGPSERVRALAPLGWPQMTSDPCKPPMPQVRTLPCLHTFHSGCAEEWLKKKKVCPLCNFPIDGTAEQGDGGTAQAAGGGPISS